MARRDMQSKFALSTASWTVYGKLACFSAIVILDGDGMSTPITSTNFGGIRDCVVHVEKPGSGQQVVKRQTRRHWSLERNSTERKDLFDVQP